MKELIEKLKDKNYVRAFGMMTPEDQECFRKVGKKNCSVFGAYAKWLEAREGECFKNTSTYAIKSNYKPEPEFVDLEIKNINNALLVVPTVEAYSFLSGPTRIHKLPSLPNFEGFYGEDELVKGGGVFTFAENIARQISEGKKVFARFRTNGGGH